MPVSCADDNSPGRQVVADDHHMTARTNGLSSRPLTEPVIEFVDVTTAQLKAGLSHPS
jgi:pyruvate-formate lyase-activating enzyme